MAQSDRAGSSGGEINKLKRAEFPTNNPHNHPGQIEDKNREIAGLRGHLTTAEARLGGLEGRLAEILKVNKVGFHSF